MVTFVRRCFRDAGGILTGPMGSKLYLTGVYIKRQGVSNYFRFQLKITLSACVFLADHELLFCYSKPGPEVIKLFPCSIEHGIYSALNV